VVHPGLYNLWADASQDINQGFNATQGDFATGHVQANDLNPKLTKLWPIDTVVHQRNHQRTRTFGMTAQSEHRSLCATIVQPSDNVYHFYISVVTTMHSAA
jgi:hypothetical protein